MQLIPLVVLALAAIWIWESAPWLVFLCGLGIVVLLTYLIMQARRDRAEEQATAIEALEQELEKQRKAAARSAALQRTAIEIIERHRTTLARKARQVIYKDDYGVYVFDKWFAECNYFMTSVLSIECPGILEAVDLKFLQDSITAVALDHSAVDNAPIDSMTPREFELYCAAVLENSGWATRVTPEGADQGVDIVAVLNGCTAVIQCKLYSRPVGNSAVQEAVAGRAFESAEIAAVVSNSSYTRSARQLASTTNVHLLHFSELTRFLEIVSPNAGVPG